MARVKILWAAWFAAIADIPLLVTVGLPVTLGVLLGWRPATLVVLEFVGLPGRDKETGAGYGFEAEEPSAVL